MTHGSDPPDRQHPPEPPRLPRRVHLYRHQWVGLPLLAVLPLLAMFRFFGDTHAHAMDLNRDVRVEVRYPDRMRTGQHRQVEIRVENVSGSVLDNVTVALSPEYLDRFSGLSFVPGPRDAYRVELADLAAGEQRRIRVELTGRSPWWQRGEVTVTSTGAEAARVPIRTFVFP